MHSTSPQQSFAFLKVFWPVLVGLLVLYIPTYYDLSQTIWTKEENAHGPMILAAVAYLFWRQRETLLAPPQQSNPMVGGIILGLGLMLYALGRSQEITMFEVGSQILVLLGTLLITKGSELAAKLWFPLFFLFFMVPLPGFIVDAMTGPLKQQISFIAETILYQLGYPIARDGVVLSIGPYQLMVADACSGLNSMFSLSAMGLLYLYLLRHPSKRKTAVIIACILPIAFIANLIRVVTLVLVTYYFGDAVGQGFLHGFAGMVLFSAALLMLFMLDGALDLALLKLGGDPTSSGDRRF